MKKLKKIIRDINVIIIYGLPFLLIGLITSCGSSELIYSGYSRNKQESMLNGYFICSLKPNISSVNLDSVENINLKNSWLEKRWEGIGSDRRDHYEASGYQIIIPVVGDFKDLQYQIHDSKGRTIAVSKLGWVVEFYDKPSVVKLLLVSKVKESWAETKKVGNIVFVPTN